MGHDAEDASDLIVRRQLDRESAEKHFRLAEDYRRSFDERTRQLKALIAREGPIDYANTTLYLDADGRIVELETRSAYQVKLDGPAPQPADDVAARVEATLSDDDLVGAATREDTA